MKANVIDTRDSDAGSQVFDHDTGSSLRPLCCAAAAEEAIELAVSQAPNRAGRMSTDEENSLAQDITRPTLTDPQFAYLIFAVEAHPEPVYSYGLFRRIKTLPIGLSTEQGSQRTLARLVEYGLLNRDEDPSPSSDGPGRSMFRVASLEVAREVIRAEQQRRQAFLDHLIGQRTGLNGSKTRGASDRIAERAPHG